MKSSLKGAGRPYEDEIGALRRHLHRHPELSGEEYGTSEVVKERLGERDIPVEAGYAGTGVLGIIEGGKPGKTVALRADMDALPIREETGLQFASENEGVMHACGHDAHTAMLVGAGWLLNGIKEKLPGRVLLVFQPAEENSPHGGAREMMESGVFEGREPEAIFAQHVWPDLPVGKVGVRGGAMTGASDRFKIVIEGVGGHASKPHKSTDAIVVANQVINNLQSIVSRDVDPLKSAVLTIGRIEGGSRYNVIAESVTMEGTIRTFSPETKDTVKDRFHSIINGVADSMEAVAHIEYWDGYPATINTHRWAALVRETAQVLLGKDSAVEIEPSLGGEDFGRFLQNYPGAYFRLGTAAPHSDERERLHDPRFDIDEAVLPVGMEFMSQIAVNALRELEDRTP